MREFELKPPPKVQAEQVTKENAEEIAAWCGGTVITVGVEPFVRVGVEVDTLIGLRKILEGSYVVKDGAGNYHQEAASNFEAEYQPVVPTT